MVFWNSLQNFLKYLFITSCKWAQVGKNEIKIYFQKCTTLITTWNMLFLTKKINEALYIRLKLLFQSEIPPASFAMQRFNSIGLFKFKTIQLQKFAECIKSLYSKYSNFFAHFYSENRHRTLDKQLNCSLTLCRLYLLSLASFNLPRGPAAVITMKRFSARIALIKLWRQNRAISAN